MNNTKQNIFLLENNINDPTRNYYNLFNFAVFNNRLNLRATKLSMRRPPQGEEGDEGEDEDEGDETRATAAR